MSVNLRRMMTVIELPSVSVRVERVLMEVCVCLCMSFNGYVNKFIVGNRAPCTNDVTSALCQSDFI